MIRHHGKTLCGLLLLLLALSGCSESQKTHTPVDENPYAELKVGTDTTLEVMTWNIENFAKLGTVTADHVALAIAGLDVDVVALQEIVSQSLFDRVVADLDGWQGLRANSAYGDQNLAYIYRTDGPLEVTEVYEILTAESYNLPRSPLVLEGNIDNVPYVIINNHFKCCGDGRLELDDSRDEETRRYHAGVLIKQYVADYYADCRVIVVGDLNDELDDPAGDNVFQMFLDEPEAWRFTDMPIALDSTTLWSYPNWPSHIDHILINGNTFPDFVAAGSEVRVMPLHTMLPGGFNQYDDEITDHLPVVARLAPQTDPNFFTGARLGTAATLEVVTWNLGSFGSGAQETELAAMAIAAMNADVVLLQEVLSADEFAALDDALEDYDGVLGSGATADINLAVLYRNDGSLGTVSVTTPLAADPVNLLRPPLVLNGRFLGRDFAAINVHHKCCGDGVLDPEDPLDEENRRLQANLLLKNYIDEHLADVPVILAGDFNDVLDAPLADNVFLDFLIEPDSYEFLDVDIAAGPGTDWSMPGIPLHVDHILVTDELFGALNDDDFLIQVVPLDVFMPGGWPAYDTQLSDHRPVAVRLRP